MDVVDRLADVSGKIATAVAAVGADSAASPVLAAVVRLLEVSLIRVGNDEYARDNESFGLTTLRNRHVEVTSTSYPGGLFTGRQS